MQTNSKLARIFIDFSQWVVFVIILSYIAPCHIRNKRELHWLYNYVYADVFWDLKLYLLFWGARSLRSLAHRSYNFFVGTFWRGKGEAGSVSDPFFRMGGGGELENSPPKKKKEIAALRAHSLNIKLRARKKWKLCMFSAIFRFNLMLL